MGSSSMSSSFPISFCLRLLISILHLPSLRVYLRPLPEMLLRLRHPCARCRILYNDSVSFLHFGHHCSSSTMPCRSGAGATSFVRSYFLSLSRLTRRILVPTAPPHIKPSCLASSKAGYLEPVSLPFSYCVLLPFPSVATNESDKVGANKREGGIGTRYMKRSVVSGSKRRVSTTVRSPCCLSNTSAACTVRCHSVRVVN